MPIILLCIKNMSTTFYNTFSITIAMAKILAPFEYNIDIKNLWDIKRFRALPKFWHILKQMDIERTE